jgi:hypothetical protein
MKFPPLYEWVPEGVQGNRWHGHVYFSYCRFQVLTVLWPFNFAVRAWIHLQDKFYEHAYSRSIVDREIQAAIKFDRCQRFGDILRDLERSEEYRLRRTD